MKETCFLALLAGAAQGQAAFTLDTPPSIARFTLSTALHTVHGSFKVKRGSIEFDPSTGTERREKLLSMPPAARAEVGLAISGCIRALSKARNFLKSFSRRPIYGER